MIAAPCAHTGPLLCRTRVLLGAGRGLGGSAIRATYCRSRQLMPRFGGDGAPARMYSRRLAPLEKQTIGVAVLCLGAWMKLIGQMTWVLLLLTAAGLVLLGSLSRPSAAAKAPRLAQKALV
jgi:hypothetical protein